MQAKAFVIGDPIAHSRSPLIHRFWIERHQLNATYDAIHVKPTGLPSFIDRIRRAEFIGGNVTVPHKQDVADHIDVLLPAAKTIGAVNTIFREGVDGLLYGDNTDAHGFAANLDQRTPHWRDGQKAVVLGAGGAARAIVHALSEAGFGDIVVVNRTERKASALATAFGEMCRTASFGDLTAELAQADCLINSTSLGMEGQPPLPIDLSGASRRLIVNDIVYAPLETDLLKQALNYGMTVADGLGMLLHQAVPGFERWFGVRPEVDQDLRDVVLADLMAAHTC